MKTILEIQKLDRQIKALLREVDKCPASLEYKKYKQIMQEGRNRFAQLEAQANELIKTYQIELNKYNRCKGESDIVRKSNVDNINLDNISALISDSNSLLGEVSEENRKMEDVVRKAEEIVRKSADLSNKLTDAKKLANTIKAKIEAKKAEVAPKIAEIENKIFALEPSVKDVDNYSKYKEMKEKGIFPVYVNLEEDFCGGCKVELPLNFKEKLKVSKMLPCEHCGRIIMFENK